MRKMLAVLLATVFTAVMVAPLLAQQAQPIDINKASVAELQKLKGVGPYTSQKIVDERTAKGPFASLQDLQKRVPSITAEKIASWGTTAVCNPPAPVQVNPPAPVQVK